MFFTNFAKTVQTTKKQSIRIVFQYKFTITPVIFWLLNSQKNSNISQKICGLNNVLRCPLPRRLDKQQFVLEAQFLCRFISWIFAVETVEKFLGSSSFDLPFRKGVFSFGKRKKPATENLAARPTRQQNLKSDSACYRQKALLSRSPKDLKIYAQ